MAVLPALFSPFEIFIELVDRAFAINCSNVSSLKWCISILYSVKKQMKYGN